MLYNTRGNNMELNTMWLGLAVMGIIGAVVNAVKWFIIDKDFSKGSFISVGAWTALVAVGFVLAIIF